MALSKLRIGQGYDIHALARETPLILGGVHIPSDYGLQSHSDGDILLHSVIDALLGASGLGDIGYHFPDSDHRYKNSNSRILLIKIMKKIRKLGFELINIDATICIEYPRLGPYIASIINCISKDLNIKNNQINIKAKTNEGFGHIGRKKSAAAMSIVLLEKLF